MLRRGVTLPGPRSCLKDVFRRLWRPSLEKGRASYVCRDDAMSPDAPAERHRSSGDERSVTLSGWGGMGAVGLGNGSTGNVGCAILSPQVIVRHRVDPLHAVAQAVRWRPWTEACQGPAMTVGSRGTLPIALTDVAPSPAAATTGDSSRPRKGYRTPAANGMPPAACAANPPCCK